MYLISLCDIPQFHSIYCKYRGNIDGSNKYRTVFSVVLVFTTLLLSLFIVTTCMTSGVLTLDDLPPTTEGHRLRYVVAILVQYLPGP